MRLFNKFSIRKKIIAIILTVTICGGTAGLILEVYNNIQNYKQDLVHTISLNAKLIADYSVPTLLFDDQEEAAVILQKLSNIPFVLHGSITDSEGHIFAEYYKAGIDDTTGLNRLFPNVTFKNKMFYVTEAVISEKEYIGRVNLVASTDIIREHTIEHIQNVLVIYLIICIIVFVLALLLERIISQPILDLASLSREIQTSGDFSVRVHKRSSDETGILYDSFNDLLVSLEARKQERDIAETELLAERESLEKRVLERTVELYEAKLKAEESDRLKSSFLANMSHEIRTPLNAILGFANLFTDTSATDDDRQEYSRMMELSAKDLTKLIDDILDLSLIEANQIKITLEQCAVKDFSKELFEVFRHSMRVEYPDTTVSTVINIPDDDRDYILNTDRLRLKQILLNILNNASKFTSEGSIEFGYFTEEANQTIVFYVKDTGIGIPSGKLEQIFERFTKVTDNKTKLYKGTGLGLSIAMKYTKLLNGDISVESEENQGSIFYVSFPYIATFQPVTTTSPTISNEYSISLLGKTILVVEDVAWNYRYLEVLLNNHTGAKILWARNGAEAVDLCKEHPEIVLVLMDIQLPEMNGFEATRLIKELRPELPVIAQTAYVMSDEKEKCFEAGCQDFISKPIKKADLFMVLEKIALYI